MRIADIVDHILLALGAKLAPPPPGPRRARIRDVRDGHIRIRGRVRPRGQLLRAPVSGHPCVGFHLVVYEWRGKNYRFDVLLDIQQACPFSVVDESGEATVDTGAPVDLDLAAERRTLPRPRDRARGAERAALTRLLESHGLSTRNAFGLARWISYEEGILADEQEILVTGIGLHEVRVDGEPTGFRGPRPQLTLRGTTAEPLVVSNPS